MTTVLIERSEHVQTDRIHLEKWVHQWGTSVSEVVLDDSRFQFFFLPSIDGFIGYRVEMDCAVVFGDPICPVEHSFALAAAFQKFCEEKKLETVFLIVSERFAIWAANHISKVMIEVGEELIFDPIFDPTIGHTGQKLRYRIAHVQQLGLRAEEYQFPANGLDQEVQEVVASWLQSRRGPQIYLGKLNFFERRKGKRLFYIKDVNDKMLGVALLSQLESKKGWLLKNLICLPESLRGTSELLMNSILIKLREENCHYLTYGMVVGEQLGEIVGMGKISSWMARRIFKLARWIFKLGGRKEYWRKFRPREEKLFLLFSHANMGIYDARVIFKAMHVEMG